MALGTALLRGSCLALFTGLKFIPWCCRALLRSAFPSCRPWCPAAVLTQMPTGGIPQKQSGLGRAHSNDFCFIVVEVVTAGPQEGLLSCWGGIPAAVPPPAPAGSWAAQGSGCIVVVQP